MKNWKNILEAQNSIKTRAVRLSLEKLQKNPYYRLIFSASKAKTNYFN